MNTKPNFKHPRDHKPPVLCKPDFKPIYQGFHSGSAEDNQPKSIWDYPYPGSQDRQQNTQPTLVENFNDPSEKLQRKVGGATRELLAVIKREIIGNKDHMILTGMIGAAAISIFAIAKMGELEYRQTTTNSNSPIESKHVKNLDQGNLQNPETNPELYELITSTGMTIALPKDHAVRTCDQRHQIVYKKYDVMEHTAIFTAKDHIEFNLVGDVYKSKTNGRLLTRIENFSHTADGEETHLDLNVDADGWVAIDQTYDQAFNPHKNNTPE